MWRRIFKPLPVGEYDLKERMLRSVVQLGGVAALVGTLEMLFLMEERKHRCGQDNDVAKITDAVGQLPEEQKSVNCRENDLGIVQDGDIGSRGVMIGFGNCQLPAEGKKRH